MITLTEFELHNEKIAMQHARAATALARAPTAAGQESDGRTAANDPDSRASPSEDANALALHQANTAPPGGRISTQETPATPTTPPPPSRAPTTREHPSRAAKQVFGDRTTTIPRSQPASQGGDRFAPPNRQKAARGSGPTTRSTPAPRSAGAVTGPTRHRSTPLPRRG